MARAARIEPQVLRGWSLGRVGQEFLFETPEPAYSANEACDMRRDGKLYGGVLIWNWAVVPTPRKFFKFFFIGNGAFQCISRVFLRFKVQMPIAWSDIF